jgi:hypothetical protein
VLRLGISTDEGLDSLAQLDGRFSRRYRSRVPDHFRCCPHGVKIIGLADLAFRIEHD